MVVQIHPTVYYAALEKLADSGYSKYPGRNTVSVQIRYAAPIRNNKANCFWRYIMLFNFILIFGIVLMCFGLYNVKHF